MEKETVDFDNMSDEDFLRLGPPTVTEAPAEEPTPTEEPQPEEEDEEEQEEEESEEDESEEEEEEGEEEEDPEPEEDPQPEPEKKPAAERERTPEGKFKGKPKEKPESDTGFDEEEVKKLLAPFKANGREMSIRNADEGIRLMQMGANYSQKMEQLKPQLALVRTLEREGLADLGKLSFLIDLHKKNPQAIAKLVKDTNFDPLAVEDEQVAAYKPGNYQTSTKELDFDEVLEGLRGTKRYDELIDTVANKWDAKSKDELADNPGILNVFSQHMHSGVYDRVMDEIARQKALGNLKGVPVLQAYREMGQQMEQAGQLNDLLAPKEQKQRKLVTPGKDKARAERVVDEARRKAASPTRKTGNPAPKKKVVDVWAMDDAAFANLKL